MSTTASLTEFNPYLYRRRKTREVLVGTVGVGGSNPIRVQSMTTTDTMDTLATVAQTRRLADIGCEIVRITAPTVLDAQNLEAIKNALIRSGCHVPLVADIHFRPDAALVAADFVEKIRINPGNFVDGKAFKVREYTDQEYADEIRRIEDKFTPLVLKLKTLKRALRIGTNHGSLSDRIMNRYGDTPEGMVESALEYVRICEKNAFHDIILSMKTSNPRVMIAAYRLLAERMAAENMDYPFHLGVTEAGDGPDGRIKSAAGIGSLLEDGIGDTIRVSLTEDPEYEVPVAHELARRYSSLTGAPSRVTLPLPIRQPYAEPVLLPTRRLTEPVVSGPIVIGGSAPIRLISRVYLKEDALINVRNLMEERVKKEAPPEILRIDYAGADFPTKYAAFRAGLKAETSRLAMWMGLIQGNIPASVPIDADAFVYRCDTSPEKEEVGRVLGVCRSARVPLVLESESLEVLAEWVPFFQRERLPLMAGLAGRLSTRTVHAARQWTAWLNARDGKIPLILNWESPEPSLDTAAVFGSLICDGIGDAIAVGLGHIGVSQLDFSYNLLQACGSRLTKTEFVSCPSCGRTLFDLQSTTERIKSKTGHLKGVKIAIMGCIVNGPGEMADADFGYVGGGPGKINLYVGKSCVEKSIPSDVADEKLIELIKSHGKWVDAARG